MNAATEIEFDLYEDLSQYSTEALRAMVRSINAQVLPLFETGGAGLSAVEKTRVFAWIEEAGRISAEVVRREENHQPAGPCAVSWESMPDGSDPVRFTTVYVF